ncbi:hypothetical protein [Pelolinea submarina]|uniref:Uncharacterized protein n=1 Tax=Pelolinea submarina TaxID=913107 RepID=A0A3E0AFK6_9CHLR|nr:hypothetical protein [Pelolinea submarina]REG10383.1 hypothetical protein DFR64_0241 [Pelolinea submarina]
MSSYYDVPGGLTWVKNNLHIIIGNKPLEEVMEFGDTWRDRGHTPLVHVISPAMDDGKMWDQHADPSGLLDNVPSHIDMFIVDFYNLNEPELPSMWWTNTWLLWEYKSSSVRFNGTHSQFVSTFKIDPETTQDDDDDSSGGDTPSGGSTTVTLNMSTTLTTTGNVNLHIVCPHCGEQIF